MNDSQRLARIKEIIELVDIRCSAADGPVPPTLREMRSEELSEIFALAAMSSDPRVTRQPFLKGQINSGERTFDIGRNLTKVFEKMFKKRVPHIYQLLDEHLSEFEALMSEALLKNYRGVAIEVNSSEGGGSVDIQIRLLE